MAPLLIARLAEPKPRPRPTRVYLAALGMLGGERAAKAVLPWTARGSTDLAQSAMHALISMGASARAALRGAAASKNKAERAAAAQALALLDGAAYAGLRAVREARDALGAEARQALLDAHGAGWLDPRSTERRASRDALLARHGAGAAAYLIGHVLETSDSQPEDVRSVLRAVAGDPLGPWAAGLVLLERPLPMSARLGNTASRGTWRAPRARRSVRGSTACSTRCSRARRSTRPRHARRSAHDREQGEQTGGSQASVSSYAELRCSVPAALEWEAPSPELFQPWFRSRLGARLPPSSAQLRRTDCARGQTARPR